MDRRDRKLVFCPKIKGKSVNERGSIEGNKRKPKTPEVSFQKIGILFDDDGEDPNEAIKNIANFIGLVCQTGNIDYFNVYKSCKSQMFYKVYKVCYTIGIGDRTLM